MKNLPYSVIRVFCYIIIWSISIACTNEELKHDATGTFETTEIILSSQINGPVTYLEKEEGDSIRLKDLLIIIDTVQLSLQREQIKAKINSLDQKKNDPGPQINILHSQARMADQQVNTLMTQLNVLKKEQHRLQNLFNAQAATQQQLDDINGKVLILKQQIAVAESQKSIINTQIQSAKNTIALQNRSIGSERSPLLKQIDLINDQICRARIISPINGTLLNKYVEKSEFVNVGKPLLKIADLSTMILRAYVTGDQLTGIRLGQQVHVYLDSQQGGHKKYQGKIIWISDVAEFTPKTIQTKNERANLVYAVKVKVKNDGYIKIGMYGELDLSRTHEQ